MIGPTTLVTSQSTWAQFADWRTSSHSHGRSRGDQQLLARLQQGNGGAAQVVEVGGIQRPGQRPQVAAIGQLGNPAAHQLRGLAAHLGHGNSVKTERTLQVRLLGPGAGGRPQPPIAPGHAATRAGTSTVFLDTCHHAAGHAAMDLPARQGLKTDAGYAE